MQHTLQGRDCQREQGERRGAEDDEHAPPERETADRDDARRYGVHREVSAPNRNLERLDGVARRPGSDRQHAAAVTARAPDRRMGHGRLGR